MSDRPPGQPSEPDSAPAAHGFSNVHAPTRQPPFPPGRHRRGLGADQGFIVERPRGRTTACP